MAIVRAKEPFSYIDSKGVPRVVSPGQLLDDADPAVVKRSHLFEPVEVAAARATETATASPGELRSVAKKAPAKKAAPSTPSGDNDGTVA